jgi:hypothetical protein
VEKNVKNLRSALEACGQPASPSQIIHACDTGGDMAMQHGLYEDIMACIEQSMGKEADDSAEKKNVGRSDADNFLQ